MLPPRFGIVYPYGYPGGKDEEIMKRRALCCILLAAAILAALCGCVGKPDNPPYEPDTSPPPPLKGVFSSSGGTMTFNGDERTVVLDLEPGFAARTGLPEGHSEGTYVFIQDLPPHGHVPVRYDTAHNLDITVGEGEMRIFVSLDIGFAADDGSTATVFIGAVTEEAIPILLTDEGYETVLFQKTGQGS